MSCSMGRNCCNRRSVASNIISKASGKSRKSYFVVLLLVFVIILYLGSLCRERCVSQAEDLASKFSSLGIQRQHYEDSGSSIYKGYVPPFVLNSSVCSVTEPSNSTAANFVPWAYTKTAPTNVTVDYDVCLAVSIGDDGDVPNDTALPYPLVSRLLDALSEEVANFRKERVENKASQNRNLHVLVGVDYGSVVCAMVRDTFAEMPGVQVECRTFFVLEPNSKMCTKLVVGSSARFLRQMPEEWETAVGWRSRRYVDLDCPDPAHEPPALPENEWRPTIVTGFSSNHIGVGLLMIRSVGWAAKQLEGQVNVSLVVWAMEAFDRQVLNRLNCVMDELTHDFGVHAELRTFNWSAHPSWMTLHQELGYMGGTGEYAWKAIMVHTVLRERGIVLWADAGDRFESRQALAETLNYLKSTGFVSTRSGGSVLKWNHKGQLKYFRANVPQILEMGCCEGSIAGFTLKTYREMARPWYDCSLTRQCIAPDGSDRNNHRQDQAALTLLSIFSNLPCEGAHHFLKHHADDSENAVSKLAGAYPSQCYSDPF